SGVNGPPGQAHGGMLLAEALVCQCTVALVCPAISLHEKSPVSEETRRMHKKTLAVLAAELANGRTSARKLVEECLARIADPAGEGQRAFVHVDKDAALEAADAMDHLRKAN